MYIGHFAVAFAAKRVAPKASLGVLLAAAMFIDLIWPVFLLLGWERVRIDPGNTAFTPLDFVSYPYSHSLAMTLLWALVFGYGYEANAQYRTGALVSGALVISHWLLDAITHRPDLPLFPGSAVMIGAGMWNSVQATLLVESAMYAAGVALYAGMTQPRDGVGRYAFWAFVALHAVLYLGAAFGPPPPNETALAWVSLATWLFPLWAAWFDQHRDSRE